jgi:hypothetical protein
VGVWEHPVGTSTDIETDEVFVVLSGSGRVLLADGRVLELRPGTVGVLAAGTPTTWEIDETLRKVWVALVILNSGLVAGGRARSQPPAAG